MPIDIISRNNAIPYLKPAGRKRDLSNYTVQEDGSDPDFNPAYIVEISKKGKQLQQDHQVKIVHL